MVKVKSETIRVLFITVLGEVEVSELLQGSMLILWVDGFLFFYLGCFFLFDLFSPGYFFGPFDLFFGEGSVLLVPVVLDLPVAGSFFLLRHKIIINYTPCPHKKTKNVLALI